MNGGKSRNGGTGGGMTPDTTSDMTPDTTSDMISDRISDGDRNVNLDVARGTAQQGGTQ